MRFRTLFLACLLSLFCFSTVAFAATDKFDYSVPLQVPLNGSKAQSITVCDKVNGELQCKGIAMYVTTIYVWLVRVSALLALLMMMVAGFQWLTAAGESKRIEQAKKTISNALIGMVLAIGSYLVLALINPDLVLFPAITPKGVGIKNLKVGRNNGTGACCYKLATKDHTGEPVKSLEKCKELIRRKLDDQPNPSARPEAAFFCEYTTGSQSKEFVEILLPDIDSSKSFAGQTNLFCWDDVEEIRSIAPSKYCSLRTELAGTTKAGKIVPVANGKMHHLHLGEAREIKVWIPNKLDVGASADVLYFFHGLTESRGAPYLGRNGKTSYETMYQELPPLISGKVDSDTLPPLILVFPQDPAKKGTDFNFAQIKQDVESLLSSSALQMRVKSTSIAGHSNGGVMVEKLAKNNPGQYKYIGLMDPYVTKQDSPAVFKEASKKSCVLFHFNPSNWGRNGAIKLAFPEVKKAIDEGMPAGRLPAIQSGKDHNAIILEQAAILNSCFK